MNALVCQSLLIVAALAALSGCVAPPNVGAIMSESIRKSEEGATQRDKALLAQHLKLIEKLRAEGDPMGEYLWVEANEHQLVPNAVTERGALKRLYQAAADKGSIDAQHKVGLMTFYEGAIGNAGYAKSTEKERQEKAIQWRAGLDLLEKSTAKQCFHWGIVLDGMANRHCLRPVVVARQIWPKFRDGFGYPKDTALADAWKQRRDECDAYLAKQDPFFFYGRKFPACR